MQEITIAIPAVDDAAIVPYQQQITTTVASETDAVRLIREKYARYAKHNGFIRVALRSTLTTEKTYYYHNVAGRKAKGLLVADAFDAEQVDRATYTREGSRLYLLESGEWLQITRSGHWDGEGGETEHWDCGADSVPDAGAEYLEGGEGSMITLTDAMVAANWALTSILQQLAKTMTDFATKISQKHGKLAQRAELATKVIEALANIE
jgi:hypothetical protein